MTKHASSAYDRLPARVPDSDSYYAVIETPRGSQNKFKYEPELGLFLLHKTLPAGMAFPYEFGYIPGTQAEDGDPIDVIIFMDQPGFAGCVLVVRLVGVIEAEQKEKDGGK